MCILIDVKDPSSTRWAKPLRRFCHKFCCCHSSYATTSVIPINREEPSGTHTRYRTPMTLIIGQGRCPAGKSNRFCVWSNSEESPQIAPSLCSLSDVMVRKPNPFSPSSEEQSDLF